MPGYSKKSMRKLNTCHPNLKRLFLEVVKEFDNTIIEGHRGKVRQNRYFEKGSSKVKYPDGKHNKKPSAAVDSAPWLNGKIVYEPRQCYFYAGYVKAKAESMGINIRLGADWDGDKDINDQKFRDIIHFEILI